VIPEFFVTSVYKLFLYIESFLKKSIKVKWMINLSFPKPFTHFVSNTVASEKDLKYHEQLSRFYWNENRIIIPLFDAEERMDWQTDITKLIAVFRNCCSNTQNKIVSSDSALSQNANTTQL
jgi:hypothetical protein